MNNNRPLIGGFSPTEQTPIDDRSILRFVESALSIDPYKYYEGQLVYVIEAGLLYQWLENVDGGGLGLNFTYPVGYSSNGVNYSDRTFDFIPVIKNTIPVVIQLTVSDEITSLTTGTAKVTFRMPHDMTLTGVRASLTIAGTTSGLTTVDINENGVSILSTKITLDLNEKTSMTALNAAVISDSSLANDSEITIDIDTISGGGN